MQIPGGGVRVYGVTVDGVPHYRIMTWPGGYWRGDYRTQRDLADALARLGCDIADLVAVEDE